MVKSVNVGMNECIRILYAEEVSIQNQIENLKKDVRYLQERIEELSAQKESIQREEQRLTAIQQKVFKIEDVGLVEYRKEYQDSNRNVLFTEYGMTPFIKSDQDYPTPNQEMVYFPFIEANPTQESSITSLYYGQSISLQNAILYYCNEEQLSPSVLSGEVQYLDIEFIARNVFEDLQDEKEQVTQKKI